MADSMLPSIGGYLALELPLGSAFHDAAVAVNSGRNALKYLLKSLSIHRIHIPFFTCAAITEVIAELGISIKHYRIQENLEPVFDYADVAEKEAFLYTNYFGIKNRYVAKLSSLNCKIIIDNAQSFFSPRIGLVNTFYSPRKFFGVPDGGYAYGGYALPLERDFSSSRFKHLLVRHDESAQAGYSEYLASEQAFAAMPLKLMSSLTARLLQSIDYEYVARRRKDNFNFLHLALEKSNALPIDFDDGRVALTYPYLCKDPCVKDRLRAQGIFSASYWPNLKQTVESSSLEQYYCDHIVHLPIDQRYDDADMQRILEALSV